MINESTTGFDRPISCPACGAQDSERLESVVVDAQHLLYSDDPQTQIQLTIAAQRATAAYQILRCKFCHLEFANPLQAPDAEWYRLAYRALKLYPSQRWEFDAVIKAIRPLATILELGCGSGAFLKLCREKNLPAIGIDFSAEAIAQCLETGLEARTLDVCQPVLAPSDPVPDHIVAFHVLEHLDQPLALFEQAAAVASRDTSFWIAVPSHKRASRWHHETDFLDQPPHHMSRWTDHALAAIGKHAGWNLVEVVYEPMPLRNALWSIVVNSRHYLALQRRGALATQVQERIARWALYPAATVRRWTSHRQMTGFTMLARFRLAHSERKQ